eukprot:6688353-Prymnesium_polylepis.1
MERRRLRTCRGHLPRSLHRIFLADLAHLPYSKLDASPSSSRSGWRAQPRTRRAVVLFRRPMISRIRMRRRPWWFARSGRSRAGRVGRDYLEGYLRAIRTARLSRRLVPHRTPGRLLARQPLARVQQHRRTSRDRAVADATRALRCRDWHE